MTTADIERMAREAGLIVYADHLTEYDMNSAQQAVAARFAALVRAQAFEQAAQACDALIDPDARYGEAEYSAGIAAAAASIRALKGAP